VRGDGGYNSSDNAGPHAQAALGLARRAARIPTGADDRVATIPRLDSEHAEMLRRLNELDRRLKRIRAAAVHDNDEELRACREGIAALHRQLEEMRTSESWGLGNGIVRAVLAIGRPVVSVVTRPLRAWRSRAANHDRVYRQAIAAGSPLATLDVAPPGAEADGARETSDAPVASLVHELRCVRADGPRLLDPGELSELGRALASTNGEPELEGRVRHLLALSDPIEPVRAPGLGPGCLVIDVRPLQLPFECGAKTHGEHVARAMCSMLPQTTRVLMLTSPMLPDVAPSVSALFHGRFVPGATPLEDVSAFLQLMVFANPSERHDTGLLRAPWVRRTAVWLDAIIGQYPSSFLPTEADFLDYQLGIEKLGRAAHVLALSEASRAELPPNLDPATRITVSGSRPGLVATDARAATITVPEDRYCVLVGNSLPHKNIASGVAAFTRSRLARAGRMKLIVIAMLDDAQQDAVRQMAASTGRDAASIAFLQQLDRSDLSRVIQDAEAVIVPSLHEGFSLPIVESLGLATPIVASDIPAHRELLGPDPALADPRYPRALAQALDEVLARRGDALARQLRELATRYDPEQLDRATSELGAELVRPKSPPDHTSLPSDGASRVGVGETTAYTGVRPRGALSRSKVCNLEDFSHPELVEVLRDHFSHELVRFGPQFPKGREWRKHWEIAMAMRTFARAGLLDERHDFLGVGAGNEPTIFLLTRHARRVVATDLYLEPGWEESANASMLTDPGWHWPFAWRPERLQVTPMNALDLRFPDESFHAIFSSSSIEHLGNRRSIARSLDEMHRVLAPGGILSISSEYRIAGPSPGIPGVAMFDAQDIDELFVAEREWSLVDPFDDALSPSTLVTQADFATVNEDQRRQVHELGGHYTHLLEFASYPHIVLSRPPHVFTSFHVALRKHD
jgi:glycosyltransferase involved in cell wall biosynthesis/SAM-dependent methyltransferase